MAYGINEILNLYHLHHHHSFYCIYTEELKKFPTSLRHRLLCHFDVIHVQGILSKCEDMSYMCIYAGLGFICDLHETRK